MSAVDRANYVVDKSDAYDDSPQLRFMRLHFLQAIGGIENHTPDQIESDIPIYQIKNSSA